MLIFNTTYLVSDNVHGAWHKWIKEQHIPFMLQFKPFSNPQVAKVITGQEQEGTSFSVQFHIRDMETLSIWNEKYGNAFQDNCSQQFGTEVVFFTTILELVNYN
ncbi:MAG: DUF4286 family protein [Paludibacter sp.]|jgi:hypothetical protein|nr:DUF4286 family protein [Paludibacter sp.]